MSATRESTSIDAVAERVVDRQVELAPEYAVWLGRPGSEGRYGDLSPEGHAVRADAARSALRELDGANAADDVDAVTLLDLRRELELAVERYEAGLHLRDVAVIASPAQSIRDVLDLEPDESDDDWATIAKRLAAVPAAVEGYVATLREGIRRGVVPAVRQVRLVADDVAGHAAPDGFFRALAARGSADHEAVRRDLESGAAAAAAAYDGLARFLADELAPVAGEEDAVGREHYALASRAFLGATVDLDETYEWGLEELARMVAEQEAIAAEIVPGGGVEAAIAALDDDPSRRLAGTERLREWMQQRSDAAIAALAGTAFDIPEPLRRLECRIAPTTSGEIYYTSPSDDFSRPGRMWWSVPEGVTAFNTWREATTVYHEGVPGHHLQLGTAVANRDLNTWRRFAGTSGHAEGWALYAERLMADLGFLDDPGDRLGMLDGQRMRAARVVLDLGVHLRKPRPQGGGVWDAGSALAFFREHVHMADGFLRFEVNRYLGWPGQAPSYKVGQRIWEQVRDEVRRREGDRFDLKAFHRDALAIGGVGLDTLRGALLP